ncbi:MAG: hypothetical protein IT370_08945 [Deltaproteobacteria bacterium]|nr:hypothetical protein [Deltaproteobacteria bacterium]
MRGVSVVGVFTVVVAALAAQAGSARAEVAGMHEGVPWPVIEAPVARVLPLPEVTEPPPPAPTRAGRKVVALLGEIERTLTESSYQHTTTVRAREGVFNWDCSGMTAWILRRVAPATLRGLGGRPVARDFARVIARAPTERSRNGWRRIVRIDEVMPGDVFAWKRPRGMPSRNTGHVGFVVGRPAPVPGLPGGWAVRLADSSSFIHQDDTRAHDLDGGFGMGTMTFLVDAEGRVTHYGWAGTRSSLYVITEVQFGRVSP